MKDKNVLLLGHTGGIGNKTTKMLLDEGYTVFGASNNQYNAPDPKGKNFTKIYVDLKKLESIKKLQERLRDIPLYAIVNCAGIIKFEGTSPENDIAIWDETIAVNLTSNFYLSTMFEKNILKNGRFIMISSTDSNYGGSITTSYAASKSGINSLVKSLSLFNRIAKPNDVAKLIKFLLSSDSDYINGQTITIDGGYTNQDPTLLIEEKTK